MVMDQMTDSNQLKGVCPLIGISEREKQLEVHS